MENQQSKSPEERKQLRAARIREMQEEIPALKIEEEYTGLQLKIESNLLERAMVLGKFMQHQKQQERAQEEVKKGGPDEPEGPAAR